MTFTIFANALNGDYIEGTDPVTGDVVHTPAPLVVPTTITASFNDLTSQVNGGSSVPLPAGAGAGVFAIVLVLGVHYLRRARSAA